MSNLDHNFDSLNFYPSEIENTVCDILEHYECALDIFQEESLMEVIPFMESQGVEWFYTSTLLPEGGASIVMTWIENEHLHAMQWTVDLYE